MPGSTLNGKILEDRKTACAVETLAEQDQLLASWSDVFVAILLIAPYFLFVMGIRSKKGSRRAALFLYMCRGFSIAPA
jgi:hypothetical protein